MTAANSSEMSADINQIIRFHIQQDSINNFASPFGVELLPPVSILCAILFPTWGGIIMFDEK
jgi:hypothetical protein